MSKKYRLYNIIATIGVVSILLLLLYYDYLDVFGYTTALITLTVGRFYGYFEGLSEGCDLGISDFRRGWLKGCLSTNYVFKEHFDVPPNGDHPLNKLITKLEGELKELEAERDASS